MIEFRCPFSEKICPKDCPVLLEAIKFAAERIKNTDQLEPVVRVFLEITGKMDGEEGLLTKASCVHTPAELN